MPLGEFSIICFGFLVNFGGNCKMSKEEKLGKNRAFAAAKGTFAVAKSFATAKAASPWRRLPRRGKPRAKKVTPLVRYSVVVLRRSEAVLRRGEGTVHRGKNFRIVF